MVNSFLRLPAVIKRTGLSRSTVYLRIAEGNFPRSISLGGARAVGWLESDIEDWIKDRIDQSRGQPYEHLLQPSQRPQTELIRHQSAGRFR